MIIQLSPLHLNTKYKPIIDGNKVECKFKLDGYLFNGFYTIDGVLVTTDNPAVIENIDKIIVCKYSRCNCS